MGGGVQTPVPNPHTLDLVAFLVLLILCLESGLYSVISSFGAMGGVLLWHFHGMHKNPGSMLGNRIFLFSLRFPFVLFLYLV